MANIEGTWDIHSRSKKPTDPTWIYSSKQWVISKNGTGWKAAWFLQNNPRPDTQLESSDGKSFILHEENPTNGCTVRAWMINDCLLIGIATSYAGGRAGHGPEDIDVFAATRSGNDYA